MLGLLILVAIVSFFIWASADINSGVYVHCRCKGKTENKDIALTFDDGPDPVQTPKILDVLKQQNIKATFFLVGEKVLAHPDIVLRIHKEGHIIGNHTYSHNSAYPLWSAKRIRKNIQKANEAIYRIIGYKPRLFRPPFGVTNPSIAKAINGQYTCIGWNIRSFDTIEKRNREEICTRIINKLEKGSIILLHDRCPKSEILLVQLLSELQKRDFNVESLDKILNIEAYEI